jgi:hypothetical protein
MGMYQYRGPLLGFLSDFLATRNLRTSCYPALAGGADSLCCGDSVYGAMLSFTNSAQFSSVASASGRLLSEFGANATASTASHASALSFNRYLILYSKIWSS